VSDGLFRRLRRRRIDAETLVGLPDSHPKHGLIAEPVRVERIDHEATDTTENGQQRVTFLVEVRAADDARCPAVAVEARLGGPERERTVSGATDLLGRIRFRMSGPAGTYRIVITDVAAGGLAWDRERSHTELAVSTDR
jgi:hypothetical protein